MDKTTLERAAGRTALRLPTELRTRIESWAEAGYPRESCGLLLGWEIGPRVAVVEVARARNVEREHPDDRYELDPDDLLAADLRARALGLEIVGIWHPHPDHPARPSTTDRARAWDGWSYVIVSVDGHGAQELRSWRMWAGDFVEEEVSP